MDMKMFRLKLKELTDLLPMEEEDEGAEDATEDKAIEPQDGQPKKSAAINDGGQETLDDAGEPASGYFIGAKDPEGNKKKKLDVIAASMKRRLGK
jgi:hypothetical protein